MPIRNESVAVGAEPSHGVRMAEACPLEHEVRLHPALDRLLDRGVCGVDEVAQPVADPLLPPGSGSM